MDTLGSSEGKTALATVDISDREDVQKLRRHAIGLGGVLFISFAAMSPLTGQLGNVPLAIGLGNGIGAPAGLDRKSTRLNSSHSPTSYSVLCLPNNHTSY